MITINEDHIQRKLMLRNLKAMGLDSHEIRMLTAIMDLGDLVDILPNIQWDSKKEDPWSLTMPIYLDATNYNRVQAQAKTINALIQDYYAQITRDGVYIETILEDSEPKAFVGRVKYVLKGRGNEREWAEVATTLPPNQKPAECLAHSS